MVEKAAGSGDQHVNAAVDQLVLLFERDATDQQGFGELEVFCVCVEIFGNLRGQFARGAKHQAAWHTRTSTPL